MGCVCLTTTVATKAKVENSTARLYRRYMFRYEATILTIVQLDPCSFTLTSTLMNIDGASFKTGGAFKDLILDWPTTELSNCLQEHAQDPATTSHCAINISVPALGRRIRLAYDDWPITEPSNRTTSLALLLSLISTTFLLSQAP